jgi:hypothetical protein
MSLANLPGEAAFTILHKFRTLPFEKLIINLPSTNL